MTTNRSITTALPELSELPELVLGSLNAGVYVTDVDRKIVHWNHAAERITGWKAQDILGRSCSDQVLCHVDKDDRPLCGHEFCPLHRAMTTDSPSDVPSVVYALSAAGKRIPMRVSVAPLHDAKGHVIGGVETFLDMSSEIGDLQRAQRIQWQCIINEAQDDPRLDSRIHYAPCDMIGGDFCAVSRAGADRYAFIVADVTGHGLSAALYTMYLRSLWDDHCGLDTPASILIAINQRLATVMSGGGSFATALCGVVDLRGQQLLLASAGGPPPLLARSGRCQVIDGLAGLPMGLVDDGDYDQINLPFAAGDRALLFTDGAVEIVNNNSRELKATGLTRLLADLDYPASALEFGKLEECMLAFSNAIRFADDVTFLEVGVPGPRVRRR